MVEFHNTRLSYFVHIRPSAADVQPATNPSTADVSFSGAEPEIPVASSHVCLSGLVFPSLLPTTHVRAWSLSLPPSPLSLGNTLEFY